MKIIKLLFCINFYCSSSTKNSILKSKVVNVENKIEVSTLILARKKIIKNLEHVNADVRNVTTKVAKKIPTFARKALWLL